MQNHVCLNELLADSDFIIFCLLIMLIIIFCLTQRWQNVLVVLHICLKCFQLFSEISQLFRKSPFFHKGLQLRSTLTLSVKRSYIAIGIRDSKRSFL